MVKSAISQLPGEPDGLFARMGSIHEFMIYPPGNCASVAVGRINGRRKRISSSVENEHFSERSAVDEHHD